MRALSRIQLFWEFAYNLLVLQKHVTMEHIKSIFAYLKLVEKINSGVIRSSIALSEHVSLALGTSVLYNFVTTTCLYAYFFIRILLQD